MAAVERFVCDHEGCDADAVLCMRPVWRGEVDLPGVDTCAAHVLLAVASAMKGAPARGEVEIEVSWLFDVGRVAAGKNAVEVVHGIIAGIVTEARASR